MATRERCAAQVREYLARKRFAKEEIEAAIETMVSRRLIDDARFARVWVEARARSSPRAGRLLIAELRAKGIDGETAREAVARFLEEVPEEELAERVLARRRGRAAGAAAGTPGGEREDRERTARALTSRGFRSSFALSKAKAKAARHSEGQTDDDDHADEDETPRDKQRRPTHHEEPREGDDGTTVA